MRTKALLFAAVVPLMAMGALAQDKKPSTPPAQNPPAQNPPKPAPGTTPPKDTKPAEAGQTDQMRGPIYVSRATQVIGGKVTNANKEDLGKVEEIVINPANGQIQYAVVSFGGIMGMGDKLFAVPWSLLKAADHPEGRKDQTFVLNVDKAKLEKAPGFPKNNWPDIYAPEWGTEIDKYYGTTRAPDAGAAVEGNRQFQIFKISELKGKKVKNTTGDELGDIKDIVIDPRSGRITYFVLTSGGFLGMNNKLFAIPWEAVKVNKSDKGKEDVILNVPKEKFEKAPEFKDEDWNRMSDPVYVKEIYTYYGVRPYWPSTTDAGFEKPMPPGGANERGEEHH